MSPAPPGDVHHGFNVPIITSCIKASISAFSNKDMIIPACHGVPEYTSTGFVSSFSFKGIGFWD